MKQILDIWNRFATRCKTSIVHYALCIVAVLLASACGHDELVAPDVYVEEKTPYVEIRIAVPLANPAATRANPMGGEEGNGRERGILNEDKIHDINIFFFRDDAGMNGDENTTIDYHFFYNLLNPADNLNSKVDSISEEDNIYFGEKYFNITMPYWGSGDVSETKGLSFLAVANIGEIQKQSVPTLGALRNLNISLCDNTWKTKYADASRDASKMDFFLMSTAYDDAYTYGGASTGTNRIEEAGNGEFHGTTTLQRLYSRLDLWYNESKNAVKDGDKVKELKYQVKDATKKETDADYLTENMVYITDVHPVNVMKTPSFLFKKVTDFGDGWSTWTRSGFGDTSNYKWGGKENPKDLLIATPSADLPLNYVMEPHTLDKSAGGATGNIADWYGNSAVAKVKVDILTPGTGKLSAYYHGKPNSASDPDYGSDHISIISYANENTHPTDCFHSNYLTGMAFRAIFVPDKIYGAYEETTGADGKTEWQLKEMTGTPTKIYRYAPTIKEGNSESRSIYFSDKTVAEAYAQANPLDMAIITEYSAAEHDGVWGFVCYYNLWLRHYNNESGDPTENYPMEYATVRNNIYRVSLGFSGPGDPTPTMREPDTMKARIFVRKWNYREEETLEFD